MAMNRYMEEQGEVDDGGVDAHGRAGEMSLERQRQGEGEDGEGIRVFGDAYDLLVWG
jgi:hypothetical protein